MLLYSPNENPIKIQFKQFNIYCYSSSTIISVKSPACTFRNNIDMLIAEK